MKKILWFICGFSCSAAISYLALLGYFYLDAAESLARGGKGLSFAFAVYLGWIPCVVLGLVVGSLVVVSIHRRQQGQSRHLTS